MSQQVKPVILGALLLLLFLTVSYADAMDGQNLTASIYRVPTVLNTPQEPLVERRDGIDLTESTVVLSACESGRGTQKGDELLAHEPFGCSCIHADRFPLGCYGMGIK